jgi:hypothetical protein
VTTPRQAFHAMLELVYLALQIIAVYIGLAATTCKSNEDSRYREQATASTRLANKTASNVSSHVL